MSSKRIRRKYKTITKENISNVYGKLINFFNNSEMILFVNDMIINQVPLIAKNDDDALYYVDTTKQDKVFKSVNDILYYIENMSINKLNDVEFISKYFKLINILENYNVIIDDDNFKSKTLVYNRYFIDTIKNDYDDENFLKYYNDTNTIIIGDQIIKPTDKIRISSNFISVKKKNYSNFYYYKLGNTKELLKNQDVMNSIKLDIINNRFYSSMRHILGLKDYFNVNYNNAFYINDKLDYINYDMVSNVYKMLSLLTLCHKFTESAYRMCILNDKYNELNIKNSSFIRNGVNMTKTTIFLTSKYSNEEYTNFILDRTKELNELMNNGNEEFKNILPKINELKTNMLDELNNKFTIYENYDGFNKEDIISNFEITNLDEQYVDKFLFFRLIDAIILETRIDSKFNIVIPRYLLCMNISNETDKFFTFTVINKINEMIFNNDNNPKAQNNIILYEETQTELFIKFKNAKFIVAFMILFMAMEIDRDLSTDKNTKVLDFLDRFLKRYYF